jgi:hypothetical protein
MKRRKAGRLLKGFFESAEVKPEECAFSDTDRDAIIDYLKSEMKAGKLRYVSDEVKRKGNRKG